MISINKSKLIIYWIFIFLSNITFSQEIAFPNKPVHLIVTFPPGGTTTFVGRLIAQKLSDIWNQPVILENKPGANSTIGTEYVVKSKPDGYTILLVVNTHVINPLVMKLPYDTFKDLTPICTIYSTEYVLVTHPSVSGSNLQEFISKYKLTSASLSYASGDAGGITNLVSELFNMQSGLKIKGIPYKGSAPAVADTIGGHVQVFIGPPSLVVQHIQSGKLKSLAVTGPKRISGLPNVPTFKESGMQNFNVTTWYGLLAPTGTPKLIVDKISKDIEKILNLKDVKESLNSQGLETLISGPEDFESLMRADHLKYENVINSSQINFNQ